MTTLKIGITPKPWSAREILKLLPPLGPKHILVPLSLFKPKPPKGFVINSFVMLTNVTASVNYEERKHHA